LLTTFLTLRTGYSWPWEGPAESATVSSKVYLRYLVRRLVVVVLVLVVFIFFPAWIQITSALGAGGGAAAAQRLSCY
jgi:small-conductance mechanosensitive channel